MDGIGAEHRKLGPIRLIGTKHLVEEVQALRQRRRAELSIGQRYTSGSIDESLSELRRAALDTRPIAGLTHRFYRYPARFSPAFAAAAIASFSKPGELVLDPYMGGGTTVVEALAQGRRVVGCDLNSLAIFIGKVKTTVLSTDDRQALTQWAGEVVPSLLYSSTPEELPNVLCMRRTRNLSLPSTRPIKKVLALALLSLRNLPSKDAEDFARCALLNVGQWALNGRKRATPLHEFRRRLSITTQEMLTGLGKFERKLQEYSGMAAKPVLIHDTAVNLELYEPLDSEKASLVVSSPPYPGIHMLYHRWQVDGRRETPAPYWLAACQDGQSAAFYNFADRRAVETYFVESLRTLKSIRRVLKDGALFVQMVAFSNPEEQLPRYLQNMSEAEFRQVHTRDSKPIWRAVPGRRWHATIKGPLSGSREIVLVHRAC